MGQGYNACPICNEDFSGHYPCGVCAEEDSAPHDLETGLYYVKVEKGTIHQSKMTSGIWMMDPDHPKRVYFSCFGCGAICTVMTADVTHNGVVEPDCVSCGACHAHQWVKFVGWEAKKK